MSLVFPDPASKAAAQPASDAAQVAAQGVMPQQAKQPAQPAGRLVFPQERERTWGQAAADTGVQLAEGVNTILGAVPSLVAPDGGVAGFFRDNAEFWRKKQSAPLQVRSDLANVAIDKAGEDGVIAQVLEAASQYSSDPGLAARFVVTNLPSMIPSIGAAKLAQVATAARTAAAVKAGTMSQAAAAAAGAAAATTAGGVTNAALNAGGARGEAFEDIKRTLLQRGYSEEEANQRALDDSRLPAAVGGVTGFISGRTGLESALFGVGGTGNVVRRGVGKTLAELGGEQLEELSPKVATNFQAGQYDNRPLTQDVGRTIVETAIGSGPQSVVAGVSEAMRSNPAAPTGTPAPAGQPPVPAPVQAPPAPPAAPAGTIVPPTGGPGAPGAAVPPLDPANIPPELDAQNRDRTRPASVLQMQSIAQNPDYLRLGPSRSPDTGAPMVFAQGDDTGVIPDVARGRQDIAVMSDGQRVPFTYAVVDASLLQPSNFADGTPNPLFGDETPGLIKPLNNGRSAGLRSAWAQGTAAGYAADLEADADQHGIAPEVIWSTPNPVLVRLYSQADNRPNMAARSQGQGLGMSPGELARQDAPLIDAGLLAVWQGGDVADTRNLDFVRGFVGRLQGTGQDLAGMMTQAGTLSPAGRARIQAALAQSAYGDADLIGEMFDSTDTDIKSIGEALKAAAPEWADMRDSARGGAIDPAADITPSLLGAVAMVRRARQQRQSLSDLARQTDITTGQPPDPMVLGALRLLYGGEFLTRPMGRDRMADLLREYTRLAKGITADAGLFGDAPTPSDVLTALTKEDTDGQQQQPGAAQPAQQPSASSQQPAGGGDLGGDAGAGGSTAVRPGDSQSGAQPAAGGAGPLANTNPAGQAPAPGVAPAAPAPDTRSNVAAPKPAPAPAPAPASPPPPAQPEVNAAPAAPARGGGPAVSPNTVFTEDAAAAARARLKAKLGRLNAGIDPETMLDGITLAGYHIERGARTFAAYARAMVDDLGDAVKPYLVSWYLAVRNDPRAADFKADMDKAGAVEDTDIEAVLRAEKSAPTPPAPVPAVRRQLMVTFGGKTYPVESIEDAQSKWIRFQESANGGSAAGVSQVGNGVRITDQDGKFVARISFNGRVWDGEGDDAKVLLDAPGRVSGKNADISSLPAGWTEARPGGMATNPDPKTGGIVDVAPATGEWFAIPNDKAMSKTKLEGFKSRADAFAALERAIQIAGAPRDVRGYGNLEKVAERLGVKVFKAAGGWHASNGWIEIPDADVDVVQTGAVSNAHVFAHELGHAIMQKRQLSFAGFPRAEVLRYIPNWDDLKAASQAFRPGVHEHENERYRKHAAKPNEVIADAIASVLLGTHDIALIRPMMQSLGLTERDLGLDPAADSATTAQTNQESPDAEPLQPGRLPSGASQPTQEDAAPGPGNRQPVDAGMAGEGPGPDSGGRVPAGADGAGAGGKASPGQRDGNASGEARNPPGVGPESGAPSDFDLAGEDIGTGGLTKKYRDNIAAIKIIKALEAEARPSTADERRALARYVGWGALKGVFDPANKQWAKQHAELRGLLTDKEWEAARASTLNAHFTSPVVVNSMYSVLERLGATRGRLLEPSVGSGNFFGLMPKSMRSAVQLFGVELDPITSRIAAGLYPSAKVRNQGFEDFDVPGGFFDIAVGNPPFGNEPLADLQGTPYSGWSIHNYFFAKTIDKLRPGGVMAMVVSHNFLDAADGKARRWIADRASLIGAVRLPRTAFMENAGTEVVTDIIVFQKHDANGLPADSRSWLDLGEQSNNNPKTGDIATHRVNRYFLDNPGSVLGTPSAGGTMYKANEYTVEPSGDLEAGLKRWEATLPEGIFTPIDRTEKMQADEVPDGVKVGSFFVAKDGSVRVRAQDEAGERRATPWTAPNDKAAARIKGMVGLRDSLRAQMRLERSPDATEKQIEVHRRELNRLYDGFQKSYGFANDPTNRRLFIDDTEASLVLALEFDYDRGVSDAVAAREGIEPRKPSARKADIFKRRVLFPPQDGMVVTNARDAMLASLNFRGTLDLDYMSRLYGKDQDAIVKELGDLVFADPSGKVVTADEYLSGDVKTKLAEAEVAAKTDAAMTRNVEALRKVIPEDKRPSEIHASIGAKFVPGDVLEQFAKRISGGTVKAHYVTSLGRWLVSPASNADSTLNVGKWGIPRMPALAILDHTISGKSVVVTDTFRNADGSTTTVVNEKETEAARDKQRAIQEEWQGWLWSDPERSAKIVADYNEQMNRWVDRSYDGAHLTLPGKVPDEVIGLLPHQKNGVWRALQSRQILLDHVVGAGKTFQMVSIAMELRRTGVARKPLFAVPNHLTLQWFSEFARLYPGSNVLAATPEDFSKGNRERFFSKIITGDWDAVIVGHSSLKKIALPAETEQEVLTEQVREISDAIEMMKRSRGDSRIVGDMERIKRNLEAKMKTKLAALGSRDKVVTFDELGVDAFFVDELHEFKNLFYTSTMDRVPGMGNPNGSDKAFDLFVKLQWMFNTLGKQAPIIGATGTPVSNSLVEMFNMQRFLQYPQLKEEGLHVFDAWARQFGSVENVYEVAPSGTGYRSSNRFSKFKNLGALMAHYNAFADVVTLDDLKAQEEARGSKFPVPKIRGGRPTVVVADRSPLVANFMGVPKLEMGDKGPVFGINFADGETVAFEEKDGKFRVLVSSPRSGEAPVTRLVGGSFETEAEARLAVVEAALSPRIGVDPNSILGQFQNLRQLTKETKGRVNALSLTGAANKAGLDYRLIDPSAPDFPGSKINLAIENMMVEYRRWEADKGAQLVFCDLSVPLSERGSLASTARRLYVREDGVLVHKRGTMHTVDGFEALPFFLVQSGAGATKTFTAYDAATGILLRSGFKSKGEALVWVTDAAKNEDKRQKWIDQREAGQEITQDLIDDYDNANEIDASESPYITPQDIAGVSASAKFSVYDDIKAKLVKKGVPESEIAFIHDYSTPAAKDKLFKAVRRGDVRFLLGSTPKMGAGTNVQNRLVALHHIDAPWRPSDLEQREGRIIRRGNELYERDPEGFEIGLYRYATKQTYDTRRWQILEHKARGIEQLRNYDGMSNEIEDIDGEAANAAEMKAAASGDPLILRETQLRNEVKRLETLQAAHADAVTSAIQRANDNRRYYTEYGPKERASYEALKQVADKYPVPEDGLPAGVKMEGKAYTDRKEFTQAVAQAIGEIIKAGSPVTKSVQYRGLRFRMSGSGTDPFRLEELNQSMPGLLGAFFVHQTGEAISASGLVQRMANYVERIGPRIEQIDASIAEARDKEQKWLAESRGSFGQAKDLESARQQHKRVQRMLLARGPEIPEEQKPILAKTQEKQRKALREAGFGDALDELMASATASDGDESTGTGPVFSRTDMPTKGMTPANAQRIALGAVSAWKNKPRLVVARSIQDPAVPQALRDEDKRQRAGGATGDVRGTFFEGAMYVFSDHMGSDLDVIETVFHEGLGHYGLRGLFGDALDAVLDMINLARPDLMRPKAAEYGADLRKPSHRRYIAEEVLASMAQNEPTLGFVRRAVAAIRTWLRTNVPGLEKLRLTDAEIIRNFILPARQFVMRGQAQAGAGRDMAAAFQRAQATDSQAFKRWFGASKVVDGEGRPLVVYHGTFDDFSKFSDRKLGANTDDNASSEAYAQTSRVGFWFNTKPMAGNKAGYTVDMPVYLSIQNPKREMSLDWLAQGLESIKGRTYRKRLIEEGYDGVVLGDEEFGGTSYIAFRPTQIKSAIGNTGAFDPANPDIRFSRTPPASGASQTPAQRAETILATPVTKARPLDRVFRAASRVTGLEFVARQAYDRAGHLLDRLTPETVKAGIVSDYGVPEAVIDMRVMLQGRQRQQLRQAGELVDKLSNLTRAESRIAYEWMNMDGSDPRAYLSMMQGLPEESVKVLQEVQRMIDDLSKEAVRLGQLDPRSYERNKFAYLRRTYDRYLEELTPQQQRAHQKATRILGDQYRMRGLVEPVDMAKIKSGDPEWWGRKEREGKGDTGLVNQKFIKLERLKPTGAGTIPLPGMTGKADGKVLEVVYWPAERSIPAKYSEWRRNEVFEVRDVKGGKVVLWRDFTKDEREAMGEVDEARFAIARTLQRMVHDVEVGRYLENLSQKFAKADGDEIDGVLVEASESWHRAFKPSEWVKVPDSKITGTSVHRYGKLAGKYLPGPIWNDVRFAVNGPTRPLGEVYSKILSAWKVSKTALTPAVHMNNIMANLVMADWHDVGAAHVSKALRLILAAHQRDGKGALGRAGNVAAGAGIADREAALAIMNRYRDAGGDIGSWATQEIAREQMAPLLDAVLEELGRDGDASVQGQIGVMAALQNLLHLKLPEAWAAFKASKPATVVGREAQSMIDLYQAEDDVFRLAAWLAAKEQGMDDLRAGREARRSFLDYDINAPWVDAMRRSAWPFIAFPYRAVPMLAWMAGNRPHKILKLATLLGALNMLGVAMSGDDEDDEERRRRMLPEEKAGRVWGVVPKLIRMPWNDPNGSPVYLDIRRFIPVGDVVDTGATQAAVPVPPSLMPGGPLVILGEVLMNKSAFTGKPIKLETDTPTEVTEKVLGHLYKGFAPNVPGLPFTYATDAIVNASKGKTDAFGREQSVAQAMASSVGVKLGSYPDDVLRRNTLGRAGAQRREIEIVMNGLQRQRNMNGISEAEYERKMEVQREKLRKLNQETREKVAQ
jgi:N12 class adenine-specific DNA methylase